MSLPEAFREQLPQKTDLELYEVLCQPNDYLPEALAAVKEEMRKRNLSPNNLQEIAAAAAQSRKIAAQMETRDRQQRHFANFGIHVFLLFFAVPLGLLIKWLLSVLMGP